MAKTMITSLRLPEDWLAEADDLAPRVEAAANPYTSGRKVKRASVLKIAIRLGLLELSKRHPPEG
jgi:hypothetical protein